MTTQISPNRRCRMTGGGGGFPNGFGGVSPFTVSGSERITIGCCCEGLAVGRSASGSPLDRTRSRNSAMSRSARVRSASL